MDLRRLWLQDFRNYESATLEPASGLTLVVGSNGEGKTNLLEAVGYLATLGSFRGAPAEAMVRAGAGEAVVRAEVATGERGGPGRARVVLMESEVRPGGRGRSMVNRQALRRARDIVGTLRVTVFTPDDLALVKGGPAGRRRFLDDALVAYRPQLDVTRTRLERVLRQRTNLLRRVGGSRAERDAEVAATLDVWDAKLVELGEAMAGARAGLVERLGPVVAATYGQVASTPTQVELDYSRSWGVTDGLASALVDARAEDLRRGVCTVGPHRDELVLAVRGHPVRTHASQGEQRTLALALRLAVHAVVTEATGSTPVVLLDDVFSELDAQRSAALLAHLPDAQVLATATARPPALARPELVVTVGGGVIAEAA